MKTNTSDTESTTDLAIPQDPMEMARLDQANQVYKLLATGKVTIEEAMASVGKTRQTYYDWLSSGVFQPIITQKLNAMMSQLEAEVLNNWPLIIKETLNTAMGISSTEEGEIYPRDQMKAAQWLLDNVLAPLLHRTPESSAEEQQYIESLKKKEGGEGEPSSWAPNTSAVDMSKLKPGDEVTIKIGRDAVDVTSSPGEKDNPTTAK